MHKYINTQTEMKSLQGANQINMLKQKIENKTIKNTTQHTNNHLGEMIHGKVIQLQKIFCPHIHVLFFENVEKNNPFFFSFSSRFLLFIYFVFFNDDRRWNLEHSQSLHERRRSLGEFAYFDFGEAKKPPLRQLDCAVVCLVPPSRYLPPP